MSADVLVITFAENAKTYEAFTKIKNSISGLDADSMVIVDRAANGALTVEDSASVDPTKGFFNGSLIGMLVGVLGGPIGMLLGLTGGAALGSLFDSSRFERTQGVISEIGQDIKPGHNAIIAEYDGGESEVSALVQQLGGTMKAVPRDQVLSELEAQQDAAEAADKAAKKAVDEHKRAERKEDFDARLDKLREKFHPHSEK